MNRPGSGKVLKLLNVNFFNLSFISEVIPRLACLGRTGS